MGIFIQGNLVGGRVQLTGRRLSGERCCGLLARPGKAKGFCWYVLVGLDDCFVFKGLFLPAQDSGKPLNVCLGMERCAIQ